MIFKSEKPVEMKTLELKESGHLIISLLKIPEDCFMFYQINLSTQKKRKVYYTFSSLGWVFEIN